MEDESLISEVREHPCLYNTRSPDFKVLLKKENAWKAIAASLGVSGELLWSVSLVRHACTIIYYLIPISCSRCLPEKMEDTEGEVYPWDKEEEREKWRSSRLNSYLATVGAYEVSKGVHQAQRVCFYMNVVYVCVCVCVCNCSILHACIILIGQLETWKLQLLWRRM